MLKLSKLILNCLDKKERYLFIFILSVSFITSVVEIVGMATMAPFMVSVMGTGTPPSILMRIYEYTNKYIPISIPSFLGAIAILGMSAMVISNFINSTLQVKIPSILAKRWGRRIYTNIMYEDFEKVNKRHTSELQLIFNSHMGRALLNVLAPTFIFISKALLLGLICTILLIYNPLLTLGICAFYFLIGASLYRMGKGTLEATGKAVTIKLIDKEKALVESLAQLKLIKLWNKSELFIKNFTTHDYVLQDLLFKSNAWSFIPRYILEATAYITMVVVSLLVLASAESKEQVITIISLFALAAYRSLPSVQAIITNSSVIKANADVFEIILPYLHEPIKQNIHSPIGNITWNNIQFQNVSYRYPNAKTNSLKDANMNIGKTGLNVVIGRSGSGKTTLLNLLLGLTTPSEGHVMIDDQKLHGDVINLWQNQIGYVPQEIVLFDEPLEFNICMGESASDEDLLRLKKCLEHVDLPHFEPYLDRNTTFKMGQGGRNISGGQRQRIGLARALYRNSQLIVLDEITSNLDVVTEAKIIETVKEISKTTCVIWVTHSQRVAETADNVLLLNEGRVEYSGKYSNLLGIKTNFKSIFAES